MNESIKTILFIAATLLILAVSKPSKQNFISFDKKTYINIEHNNSLEELTKISLINAKKAFENIYSKITIEYEDKIFYATVLKGEEEYLGIFGCWIKIN